jgi:hypothetical protein
MKHLKHAHPQSIEAAGEVMNDLPPPPHAPSTLAFQLLGHFI